MLDVNQRIIPMKGGDSCGGLKSAESPTLILRPSYKTRETWVKKIINERDTDREWHKTSQIVGIINVGVTGNI